MNAEQKKEMELDNIARQAFVARQEHTPQEWEVLSPAGNPIKDKYGKPMRFPSKYAAKAFGRDQTIYNEVTVRRVR